MTLNDDLVTLNYDVVTLYYDLVTLYYDVVQYLVMDPKRILSQRSSSRNNRSHVDHEEIFESPHASFVDRMHRSLMHVAIVSAAVECHLQSDSKLSE